MSGLQRAQHAKIRGYDPVIKKEVPLYHPRTQEWHEHFRWNNDFTLIIGLTPTGRVTLESLKLNRQGLINLRQVLYAAGKHPPFLT